MAHSASLSPGGGGSAMGGFGSSSSAGGGGGAGGGGITSANSTEAALLSMQAQSLQSRLDELTQEVAEREVRIATLVEQRRASEMSIGASRPAGRSRPFRPPF